MEEQTPKKRVKGRPKGHGYERDLMHKFIGLGWTRCKTSRSESRNRDNLKIDLCYTDPFNVQAKAVESLGPLHNVLAEMPKEEVQFNVVYHKKNRKGTVVAMSEEDFVRMVNMLIAAGSITPA